MCGIFGIINFDNTPNNKKLLARKIQSLFKLSESRGKEASGLAILDDISDEVTVIKSQQSASELIRNQTYRSLLSEKSGSNL